MAHSIRTIAIAAALSTAPALAQAAPISFTFNAGPVLDIPVLDPFLPPALLDFDFGENVLVDVTLDDATLAVQTAPDTFNYIDPLGIITVTGENSGASVTLAPGVDLELQNNNEFDVSSPPPAPTATVPALSLFLANDTDFRSVTDFITDPTDLTGTVSEISALFLSGIAGLPNLSTGSTAELVYADTFAGASAGDPIAPADLEFFFAMEFGPVLPPVPLPAAAPLMLGAFGLVGLMGLRRSRAGYSKR